MDATMEPDESETAERNNPPSDSSGSDTVINVKQFLQSWDDDTKALSVPSPPREQNAYIADQMGIGLDLADELSGICGMDTLECGDEPVNKKDLLLMKGIPKDLDLTCVKFQERDLERRKMVDYKLFVIHKMKYRMLDVMQLPIKVGLGSMVAEEKRVPQPNVVLMVRIYRPRLSITFLPKGEEFLVLGTQSLAELKDKITCIKDDAIAGDFSSIPNVSNEGLTSAKQIYKSGLFFIENTFYNDMREADNRDYSENIMKWAREQNHESSPHFRKAKMEDTKFLDLNLQLGVPYLYQHQGNCEHIMIFTDIRLLHRDDPQDVDQYPYVLSETTTKRTVCRACRTDSAKWVVHDSQLTPESPCFMCHNCFTMLHYDQNGHKICSFQAYKYRQKTGLQR